MEKVRMVRYKVHKHELTINKFDADTLTAKVLERLEKKLEVGENGE
jgi:hypothetical protein